MSNLREVLSQYDRDLQNQLMMIARIKGMTQKGAFQQAIQRWLQQEMQDPLVQEEMQRMARIAAGNR